VSPACPIVQITPAAGPSCPEALRPALRWATFALLLPLAASAAALPPDLPRRLVALAEADSALEAVQRARFESAARYSEQHDGASMLVLHRGQVAFERYAPGVLATTPHPLASGTKSFCGAIAAAAVEDGILAGFDELASDTLVEWKGDSRKSRITIRQLLSLTSGMRGGPNGRPPSYAEAIDFQTFASPGARFEYGPVPFQAFGEVMRRKLAPRGESVREYLERRILDPIGMDVAAWRSDRDGNINLPSGAVLTAREWAKFGEFMRRGGAASTAGGQTQVVRSELLAELLLPSSANPRYGMTFWLNPRGVDTDPEETLVAAAGVRLRGPSASPSPASKGTAAPWGRSPRRSTWPQGSASSGST
jgi:CubicO group peptidase (beta-lactamase class C family)